MSKRRKPVALKQGDKEAPLVHHLMKVVAATIILIAFVILVGLVVIVLVPIREPVPKAPAVTQKPAAHGFVFEIYPKEKKPPRSDSSATIPAALQADRKPLVAIIIDDVGYNKEIADQLMALDQSLTLSILPKSPFSKEIALAAHKAGNEIMMHLPMEPVEYPAVDPGPGVLLCDMGPDALIRQLTEDIADIPYLKGVNNHMGSKLTAESTQLYQIFSVLKKQSFFFIDSCTTEKTLCGPSAKKLQVPFAKRDIFLDNSLSEKKIRHQLDRLVAIAVHRGKAIGIAHPHPETCKVLRQHLATVKQRVQLVPASALVNVTN